MTLPLPFSFTDEQAYFRQQFAITDPHLPLARLRARSQFTKLRAADLRFTPTDATEFHLWFTRLILHCIEG